MYVQIKQLISGFPSFIPTDIVSHPSGMLAAAPTRKGNRHTHTLGQLRPAKK